MTKTTIHCVSIISSKLKVKIITNNKKLVIQLRIASEIVINASQTQQEFIVELLF